MNNKKNRSSAGRRWCLRVLLFLYDAFSVNFAYFIAIIMRFSDKESLYNQGAHYIQMFKGFAVWYTLICLTLFIIADLYRGVWRYAGFRDVKKLVAINICTAILYVCGTLLVVGRMPISVYILGAGIQFVMMCVPRLAPRYIIDNVVELKGNGHANIDIPLMIIGICENTRIIQSKIEKDGNNIVRPVCVVDFAEGHRGNTFNGLPVICGVDSVSEAITKYDVKYGIIADNNLPKDFANRIYDICEEKGIELREFVIGTGHHTKGVSIREILTVTKCKVKIIDGERNERQYNDGREAQPSFREDYLVEEINAHDDTVCIIIKKTETPQFGANEDWIRQYREEVGEDISFF